MLTCQPLPPAIDGRLSSLLANHVEVADAYHVCALRHQSLVDLIRDHQAGHSHDGAD